MTETQRVVIAVYAAVSLASFMPHFSVWAAAQQWQFWFTVVSGLLTVVSGLACLVFIFLRVMPGTVDAKSFELNWSRTTWACFLLVVAFPLLSAAARFGLPYGSRLREFDKSAWQSADADLTSHRFISVRQQMLASALQKANVARDRQSVLSLFGENELVNADSQFDTDADVGYRSGVRQVNLFVQAEEWLLIWFDEDGSILRCNIHTS